MKTSIQNNQSMIDLAEELIDKAKIAKHQNTEKALSYSFEALEIATNHHLERQTARIHVEIGSCYWVSGHFDKAIDHLSKALKLSDDIQDIYAKVEALNSLGNVYITMEIVDQALMHYNKALKMAKENGFTEIMSKVLNNLGTLYEDIKNYNVALDYYQQSLEKTVEIDDQYGEAAANLNMGNVYLSLDKLDESYQHVDFAIEYGLKHNKTLLLAHAYYTMGLICQNNKDYEKSVEYLLTAAKKAKISKDLSILFRIYIDLADSLDLQNNTDQALAHLEKALEISNQIGMEELMPRIYEKLALFYDKYNEHDKATTYYKRYYQASKEVEKHRSRERIISIEYQSKLSESLEETKVYRRLSNELKQSYDSMHVLSKIGQAMTSTHQLDDIFETLYDNVNQLMNAQVLAVGLFDETKKELSFDWVIENGIKLKSYALSLENKKSWSVFSFLNKQTLKINDIEKEYKKYIAGYAATSGDLMHSAMYAPLLVEGEVIGVFTIQAKEKNAYTDVHKDLLQSLASYLAIAIKNANKTKELAKLNKKLKTKSEHDGLTGIANRRLFDQKYQMLWDKSIQEKHSLAVLIIDIDDFKGLNDRYGHIIGDKVLKFVANILYSYQDYKRFVARYGGDEFVVICSNKEENEIKSFTNLIKKDLSTVHNSLKIVTPVTVSIGISYFTPNKNTNKEKLIHAADKQLYLSKANGKNQSNFQKL